MDSYDDFHDWTIEAISIGKATSVEKETSFTKTLLELSIRSEQDERKVLRFDGVARFIINEVLWQNVIQRFAVLDDTNDTVYQEKKQLLEGLWRLKNGDSPKRVAFIEASIGAEATIEFTDLSIANA
jgi:hypothetical protein